MERSFAKVEEQAKAAESRWESDQSPLLRKLDPRQRRALTLFARQQIITGRDISPSCSLSLLGPLGRFSANGRSKASWPSPIPRRKPVSTSSRLRLKRSSSPSSASMVLGDGMPRISCEVMRQNEHRSLKAGKSSTGKRIAAVKRTRCDYGASISGSHLRIRTTSLGVGR